MEREVAKLERREAELLDQLAAHATDYARVTELDERLRAVRAERGQAEQAWLALADELPAG